MAARRHLPDPRLDPVTRWTPARKDELVLGVRRGELTESQVVNAHGLSWEEWRSWNDRHDRHGRRGLSVLRTQELRA